MKLFAYISLADLNKIMQGRFSEMGARVGSDEDRTCSQACNPEKNYIELFENLEDVRFLQQFHAEKPEFSEGGVLVKVAIPKRFLESRGGSAIFRVKNGEEETYFEIKTFSVEAGKFRQDNFEDAVFDRDCASTVDELSDEMRFKYSPRSMGE